MNKKQYESEKLHGIYRCKKREEFIEKIPTIEKQEMPDITGIIISGIINFGNDHNMIKLMAMECIECKMEDIKIPYSEMYQARLRFIKDVIISKLLHNNMFSVDALVHTFYEFIDTPTDTTKKLQADSDARDIKRYLDYEYHTPIVIGESVINLCDSEFIAQGDFLFTGYETVKVNKRKEGRKTVYDEVEMYVIENVKIFPGKPQVRNTSKIIDCGVMSRLELYIMLKAAQKWCDENKQNSDNVMLRASYYYLLQENDTEEDYSETFSTGKGGNVISLQTSLSNIKNIDDVFIPQIEEFLTGESVSTNKCQECSSRVLCNYKDIQIPLTEEEKPVPQSLPVLSKAQKKASDVLSGNVRVIATAGSGKTTTMAYRIMNLLNNGVKPEKIGCFTFTNAGAAEMSDRIKGFCSLANIDADVERMTISTIHSFGDSLIKKYYGLLGYKKSPVLINEIQRTKLVERVISENPPIDMLIDKYKNFYLDLFKAKGILEMMKSMFSDILDGILIEDIKSKYKLDDKTMDAVLHMYMQYNRYKKENCLIEHSDQELGVLKLLKLKPDLFEEIGLEHISIDEYQDISNIQFQIIYAMKQAKCCKSVFIVGDDDQSIYGFRDANVELIKDFFDMIGENGKDIHLMENRRSTVKIVDFASKLISFNKHRIVKNPTSTNKIGEDVSVNGFDDKNEEQKFIVDKVEQLIQDGVPDSDIAILSPTNSELLLYADLLNNKGIETISINPEPILENTRVAAAVSLVKFIISNNEFDGMVYVSVRNKGKVCSKEEIEEDVLNLQKQVVSIKNISELFDMFTILDSDTEDEIYQAFLDDIQTAKNDAIVLNNIQEVYEYIIDFERFGKKQTARKEKTYRGVVLSTMHSSKGKEWPVVFCSVTKMHGRDLTDYDVPEKNRLLFVACTRAKKQLYITGVETAYYNTHTNDDSNMFLAECKEVLMS